MHIIPLIDRMEFLEELAGLHHAAWAHLNPSLTLKARIDAITESARREGIPSIFIAVSENVLVGSAAIVQCDMQTKPDLTPWLAAVYVKENFRRQGIATKLISRCADEAVRASTGTLFLYTEFASGFYEKLGWCLLERCEYRGETVDVMYRKFTP